MLLRIRMVVAYALLMAIAGSVPFLCLSSVVFAQQALPGSAEPGRIEKRFEQPRVPQSVIEPVVPEEKQLPPEQAETIRFTLNAVMIEGATVYTYDDFQKFYAEKLGHEVSLLDIYHIADAITAFYRNNGYILTTAIIPPQHIKGGIVRIRIVEGRVSNVIFEGDTGYRSAMFREWGERIKASVPLNNAVLERYALLANDLSGVKARTVIRPSKDVPGASEIVFIIDHKAVDTFVSLDNRGTKQSGPREYTAGASFNSVFGLYEKTTVMWVNTTQLDELRYLSVQHDEYIDSEGTKLTLSGNRSRGEPGEVLWSLDTRTRNVTLSASLSHPFIRSRSENLSATAGFIARDSQTEQLGEVVTNDHTRSVHVGASYDFSDSWSGVNMAALDLYQGLGSLGATRFSAQNKSRALGRADYTKVTADLSRTQQLDHGFSVLVALTGQYAATDLLSSEEFGFGGSQYGRAYDSSEITGDSGAAGKVELQYTNKSDDIGLKYYQPFLFWDFGYTHDRDPVNEKATRTGASAGFGLRFGITDYVSGSVEVDRPLTRSVAVNEPLGKGKDPRIFLTLTARY